MPLTRFQKAAKALALKLASKKRMLKGTVRNMTRSYVRANKLKGPFKPYSLWDPFPMRYKCKLRYVENWTMSTGTGGIYGAEKRYSLNSLYDPYMTGTGHQPYGYDQLTPLYKKYIVKGCKVKFVIIDPSEDGMSFSAMVQGSGGAGSVTSQTADVIQEQPYSIVRDINNTGKQLEIVKQYFPCHTIEGVTAQQWNNETDSYGALVSASPTFQPTINFAVGSSRGTVSATLIVRVELIYDCIFYDRTLLTQS